MNYTDLDVWIKSRELANDIYDLTKTFPKDELYSLSNQIRRSAISVPSNIAEGCGRRTSADTIQFLHIARGSLYEMETQIYISFDQRYVKKKQHEIILNKILECKKLLNGFIKYYKSK